VASLGLHGVFGAPLPSSAQYVAATAVISAAFMLSIPTIRAFVAQRYGEPVIPRRLMLFVCGGNTSRSPMAAAIARAELAAVNGNGAVHWDVESAGVAVREPGAPLSAQAVAALRDLGIDESFDHRAKQLTPTMCVDTDVVYCMTREQRDKVIAIAPGAAERTICLDPAVADVDDPAGGPADAYQGCATRLRTLVRARLQEQRERYAVSASASASAAAAADGAMPAVAEGT
jgi:protein-tyrosine-phosphatase